MNDLLIKRFRAYRTLDISDTHEPHQVNAPDEVQFEGVVFSNGKCVINWRTAVGSISVWDSFEDAMRVHGHPEYGTKIVFVDAPMPLPWDDPDAPEQLELKLCHRLYSI